MQNAKLKINNGRKRSVLGLSDSTAAQLLPALLATYHSF